MHVTNRQRHIRRQITGMLLGSLVLVAAAVGSQYRYHRFDLTSDRIYTISAHSRELSSSLPDIVTIRYFASSRLDSLSPVPQEIYDLLEEYASYSGGKIRLERIDPDAAETARQARSSGIQPQQIEIVEDSQASIATVYSGIVVSYRENEVAIPLIFEPADVEYRITTAIEQVTGGEMPAIGVVFGSDGLSLESTHRNMVQQLQGRYRLQNLSRGEAISEDLDAVFLIGGMQLSADDLRPVEEYLVKGGNLLVAVDPVEIDLDAQLSPLPMSEEHPVLAWLAHHGVLMEPALVLDGRNRRIPVQDIAGTTQFQSYEPYPHWIQIEANTVNPDHPLTARFAGLDLYWPSPIILMPGVDREVTPLIHTSQDSWILRDNFAVDPQQAIASRAAADEQDGRFLVAGEVSGRFTPLYQASEELQPARLLVFGDADFSSDLMNFTDSSYNAGLMLNAADWLANEPELMRMRTRGRRSMRLNAIENPAVFQFHAGFARLLNMVLVPLAVLLFGLFTYFRKKR
ncbi:MAG: GldG family protein [Spirochaeta sp.]